MFGSFAEGSDYVRDRVRFGLHDHVRCTAAFPSKLGIAIGSWDVALGPTADIIAPEWATKSVLHIACTLARACCEAVAIVGLIAAQLRLSLELYPPFLAGSLALLYLHRPWVWPGRAASA